MKLHHAILKSPIFKGIEEESLVELLQTIFFTIKKYGKGEMIIFQQDVCDSLYILYKGSVVGEMFNKTGKSIVIEKIKSPKLLAPAFLFAENNHYPVGVEAIERCEAMIIPKDELIRLMQKESKVLFNFLEAISYQTVFLSKKLKLHTLSNLKGKIAHFILNQCKKEGKDHFEMLITQQELADTFGVARPSLTRALLEMAKDELITMGNKNIRILNKKMLKNLVG